VSQGGASTQEGLEPVLDGQPQVPLLGQGQLQLERAYLEIRGQANYNEAPE